MNTVLLEEFSHITAQKVSGTWKSLLVNKSLALDPILSQMNPITPPHTLFLYVSLYITLPPWSAKQSTISGLQTKIFMHFQICLCFYVTLCKLTQSETDSCKLFWDINEHANKHRFYFIYSYFKNVNLLTAVHHDLHVPWQHVTKLITCVTVQPAASQ
jgi:hypothetical protein